jgi:hypothetical protein
VFCDELCLKAHFVEERTMDHARLPLAMAMAAPIDRSYESISSCEFNWRDILLEIVLGYVRQLALKCDFCSTGVA